MNKAVMIGTAIAALVSGSALAADMPLKAPAPAGYSWAGFYIGGNAGYAWGQSDTFSPLTNLGGGQQYIPSVVVDINAHAAQRLKDSGFTGGGQIGYNAQAGVFVGGIEVDFGAFSLRASKSVSAAFTGFPVPVGGIAPTYTNTFSTNWLATARLRAGFTLAPNVLVYGTGGVAITDLGTSHTFVEGVFPGTSLGVEADSIKRTTAGVAVGGGLEYAWGNLSLKAEYLYLNFGSIGLRTASPVIFPGGPGTSVFFHRADLTANVVRAGLNWHFN